MPGFIRLSGSSARLIACITSTRVAVLGLHVFDLAGSDTVLTRARAAHRQRPGDELFVEAARLGDFRRVVGVQQIHQMKVAVAGMPDQADRERRMPRFTLGFDDTVGETGDGHADIGGP